MTVRRPLAIPNAWFNSIWYEGELDLLALVLLAHVVRECQDGLGHHGIDCGDGTVIHYTGGYKAGVRTLSAGCQVRSPYCRPV